MNRPRILLADDHCGTAALLCALLEAEPGFDVLPAVADGAAMVAAAERLSPDVILADISMPGLDGIAAATRIRRRNPAARIVFVTMLADPLLVSRGLATGALGYVLKLSAGDDLVPAVRAALEGRRFVSRALNTPGMPSPGTAAAPDTPGR